MEHKKHKTPVALKCNQQALWNNALFGVTCVVPSPNKCWWCWIHNIIISIDLLSSFGTSSSFDDRDLSLFVKELQADPNFKGNYLDFYSHVVVYTSMQTINDLFQES